jgi:uncharacterized membrane protein
MSYLQYIALYALTIPVFFAIDLVWIGVLAKGFYQTHIGWLLGDVRWVPAIIFYLLYIGGILLFAVTPALRSGSWTTALLLGAGLGLLAYATYDLTSLALIKDWPLIVTVVDMVWGTVLTALVAVASYHIAVRFILP